MKRLLIATLLAAFASSALAQGPAPVKKGLTVHEWGIFRVHEDVDFANADLRAAWDELPEFGYGHIKGRVVPHHWGAVEFRRRPIIFFYAQEPTTVRVKVDFPGGMAGVWFPATEKPAVFGNNKQPKVGNSLEWNIGVKQLPNGWQPKQPNVPAVSDRHWVSRIRQVKSDEIFARYSQNPLDVEREKFIYYDGIFPQGKWLKINVEKEQVGLTSLVKHPLFDVTIVDRRNEKPRIARFAKLDAGQTIKSADFSEVDAARFASESNTALVKQLVAAGLFDDEAKSLADLSQKEMFETPGLHLFYRLPQEEYDARLPLTLTPRPESVVRVGLVFHPQIEPDFAARIQELVQQLDSPKFNIREAAMKKLLAIGPAAVVQLQKALQRNDLSFEVRDRLEGLVRKWSSKEAFDQ